VARRRGMVELATTKDIGALPESVRESGLAQAAITLARTVDTLNSAGEFGSERDLATVARELRLYMVELAKSEGSGAKGGKVDDLNARRQARRAAG
jgi:hypothetical protein